MSTASAASSRSWSSGCRSPEVWGDQELSRELQQQKSRLTAGVDSATEIETLLEDAQTLLELAREGEEVVEDLRQLGGRVLEERSRCGRDGHVALGRARRIQCDPRHPSRRPVERRSSGLGRRCCCGCTRAGPRAHGFAVESLDKQRGRRGRYQERDARPMRGPECLRLSAGRTRRAPARAHLAVRRPGAAATRRSRRSVVVVPEIEGDVEVDDRRQGSCVSTPTGPRAPAGST